MNTLKIACISKRHGEWTVMGQGAIISSCPYFAGASSYTAVDCWTLSIQIKKKGVLLNVNFGAFYNDY